MKKILSFLIVMYISPIFSMADTEKQFFSALDRDDDAAVIKMIQDKEINVNQMDDAGDTALIWAVRRENANLVRALLNLGASISFADKNGDKVLALAINKKNIDILNILLRKSAEVDVNYIDKYIDKAGNAPLLLAIKTDDINIVNAILPQVPNPSMAMALVEVNPDDADSVKEIKNKIRQLLIKAQDQYNLYKAIDDGKSANEIEELITPNVSLNIPSNTRNPLISAILNKRVDIVQLLIDKISDPLGLGINWILIDGKTPLITAIEESTPEIVKVLLKKADPAATDWEGRSPLSVAQELLAAVGADANEKKKYQDMITSLQEAIAKPKPPPAKPPMPPVTDQKILSSLQNLTQSLKGLQVKLAK